MATIGLNDMHYATITEGDAGAVTYGTPTRMAKAISAELSVEYAEGTLYADDGVDDSVREFSSGTLKLNVNDLTPEVLAALLGQTKGSDDVVLANANDVAPEVAIGFRARKTGGKYAFIWLYRVRFSVPSENYQTKGNSIEYQTPEIEGTIMARADGNWKASYVGDGSSTDTVGKAWFNAVKEPAAA